MNNIIKIQLSVGVSCYFGLPESRMVVLMPDLLYIAQLNETTCYI